MHLSISPSYIYTTTSSTTYPPQPPFRTHLQLDPVDFERYVYESSRRNPYPVSASVGIVKNGADMTHHHHHHDQHHQQHQWTGKRNPMSIEELVNTSSSASAASAGGAAAAPAAGAPPFGGRDREWDERRRSSSASSASASAVSAGFAADAGYGYQHHQYQQDGRKRSWSEFEEGGVGGGRRMSGVEYGSARGSRSPRMSGGCEE
ncbi:hypothetical protein HK104_006344, partial [Borealophlyctis nickersoniae]